MKLENIEGAMIYFYNSKETFTLGDEVARYMTLFYDIKFFEDNDIEVKDHTFGIREKYPCLDTRESIRNVTSLIMGITDEYVEMYRQSLDYAKAHENVYVSLFNNKDLATLNYDTYILISNEFTTLKCYYTIDGGWIIHYDKDQYLETNNKRFKKDLDKLL